MRTYPMPADDLYVVLHTRRRDGLQEVCHLRPYASLDDARDYANQQRVWNGTPVSARYDVYRLVPVPDDTAPEQP